MNTRLIAIVVIVVILLGAGGFLFYNQSQNKPSQTSTETSTSPTSQENQNSILDLLASGASQECTFDYKDDTQGETSGVFFITKDKMRGDITTKKDAKTSQFSMIRVGDDNYMWGSGLEGGIKMTLSVEDLKGNEQTSSYVDLNKDFGYKCKGWVVDNSKFTPPSNVKFTDFSQVMEGSLKATPGAETKMDASVCASITDPSTKAACEKAISEQ